MDINYKNFTDSALTECDSSQERDQEPFHHKTNPLKHKTQLCKTYSEMGFCNYGDKCRFAHGNLELVKLPINQRKRNRKCHGYWGKGYCNYGMRCQFGHRIREERKEKNIIMKLGLVSFGEEVKRGSSELLRIVSN